MTIKRHGTHGLALVASLLGACAADGATGDLNALYGDDDTATLSLAMTAAAAQITSLESTAQAMRLAFDTTDPATATVAINRMDREEGFFRRLGGVPLSPSGQYLYEDTSAVLGREYCYVVVTRATDQSRGTNSDARCAFHSGDSLEAPPTAPTGLRVDRAFERSLRLAFEDASDNETGFSVENRVGITWTPVATLAARAGTGSTVLATISGLDMEQDYCYRVRASHASGSSLTFGTCGKTAPLAVNDPVAADRPMLVTILHPQPGSLVLSWLDTPGNREWEVSAYEGMSTTPLFTVEARDHRDVPPARQAYRVNNLDPGKLYCFRVKRGPGRISERLCESPFAARTGPGDRDPLAAVTPEIASVTAPQNGELRVKVTNPRARQVLERISVSTGERATLLVDGTGEARLTDPDLPADTGYCYRLFVYNQFGSRYSNIRCATTTSDPPGWPSDLRVTAQEGELVYLDWDSSSNADSYELEYAGRRQGYVKKDGTKTTTSSSYTFDGWEGYEYCFKVRARNEFGTSGWEELCGVLIGDDGITTYSSSLQADIPPVGYVIFVDEVDPGVGPQARLTNVKVVGNSATPYAVRFLPPGSTREDCGGSDGVVIEAGDSLTGSDLDTLYGDAEPETPLLLLACKLWIPATVATVDAMPIQVTYRR